MWGDDGIVIRLPEAADELPIDELLIDPEDIDELVVSTLPQTSLFSARFRECAARALLLPRRRPDSRTPLWQQRQRAADLLAVAAKYPSFPILLEASRECLQDVFDVPALREVLGQLRSRQVRMVSVDTAKASPFAQSLLFNWIAAYMYEGDAPLAERRAAALALDRDLLRELLGRGGAPRAARPRRPGRPGAGAPVPDRRPAGHAARTSCTTCCAGSATCRCRSSTCAPRRAGAAPDWVAELVARAPRHRSCASATRSGSSRRRTRRATATRWAAPSPSACPWPSPIRWPARSSTWSAATPAPTGRSWPTRVARRFALAAGADRRRRSAALEAEDRLVRGEFRPDGVEREWCDVEVLRQLRRRSLAALRREVEPVEQEALARFLPAWHGIPAHRRGLDALVEALGLLQGAALVASTLERDVLPARVLGYRPGDLDELCTSGDLVWVGAGAIGSSDGRVRLCFRDQLPLLVPGLGEQEATADGALHDAIRLHLAGRGRRSGTSCGRRRRAPPMPSC